MIERFSKTIICPISDEELNIVFDHSFSEPSMDEPYGDYYFKVVSINGENVCETEHLGEDTILDLLDYYSDSWIPEKEDISEIYEH